MQDFPPNCVTENRYSTCQHTLFKKKLMVHDFLKILVIVHRHYQGSNILGKQILFLWYQEPCDPWSCRFPSCDCGPRRPEQPVRKQTVQAFPFCGDLNSPSLSAHGWETAHVNRSRLGRSQYYFGKMRCSHWNLEDNISGPTAQEDRPY